MKYNWINKVEGSNPVEYESTIEEDMGYLKDWNLVQIEGEEQVKVEEAADPKDAKNMKKAPTKDLKAAPGKAAVLEEITDNRPRTINFTKNYGEEGAPAFKGTD